MDTFQGRRGITQFESGLKKRHSEKMKEHGVKENNDNKELKLARGPQMAVQKKYSNNKLKKNDEIHNA